MNENTLIIFGFILGFASGLVISDTIGLTVISNEVWSFAGSAFGAGVTALVAILVATHQIREHRNEAEATRRRQQLGARAVLASDLARIVDYVKQSAKAAVHGYNAYENPELKITINCPELELDILLRLQRLVELLEGENSIQVVELMRCYQIQHSRLKSVLDNLNFLDRYQSSEHILQYGNFASTLEATVELCLRAETMFPFARQETNEIKGLPFPKRHVLSVFRKLSVEEWLDDLHKNAIIHLMTSNDLQENTL